MALEAIRPLKAFLCHASGDKPPVRELYKRLVTEGVDAWLDQEKLLPGQDWRLEIPRAVHEADVVVVCLSNKSITKEGYVQKEIKFALDIAEEKPEGSIFLIPARLEDCSVPERLSRWQWVDLYEENGFVKLLRSLKLRAAAVGAAVEPVTFEDSSREREQRIKQLYTEGLAAFYTEDWDRAIRRFQSILSEQPNHKNAAEKLEEAGQHRVLSKLYEQAMDRVRAEDWPAALQTLDELSRRDSKYKDVAHLLAHARRQEQLAELYAEAETLHAGQKWQAVVKVFEQIAIIEPNYPDPNDLLASAQKEVVELNRVAGLNELYGNAVAEMEAARWYEARRLLEQVHKAQTHFQETERLLIKVEEEIQKLEEQNRRREEVNVLYEQAHGLLRSRKWWNTLRKMEEIRGLDEHFSDIDGIAAKAQKELDLEEEETERQNRLAALYAESVRLLKEENYQEALERWQEVRSVDPKYPDRQGVQRIARRKLAETAAPIHPRPRFSMPKTAWYGLGILFAMGAIFLAVVFRPRDMEEVPSPLPATIPAEVVAGNTLPVPTDNIPPRETNTPRPVEPSPIPAQVFRLMVDDFDEAAYSGRYNVDFWRFDTWADDLDPADFSIRQEKGKLALALYDKAGLALIGRQPYVINEPTYFEARLFLDPETTDKPAGLFIQMTTDSGYSLCGIFRTGDYAQQIRCWSEYDQMRTDTRLGLEGLQPGWHMFRFNIDPETLMIHYIVDGREMEIFNPAESIPDHLDQFKHKTFNFVIALDNFGGAAAPVGYVDYARMGPIGEDPVLFFDDFNGPIWDARVYKALPAGQMPNYKGVPSCSFEVLERSTVARLRNTLEPGQSTGWQISNLFEVGERPIRLEVRFNTVVQSPTTSIDGFLEVGLLDKNGTRFDRVGLFAGALGRDRTFAGKPYDFTDKTWYRLVITGSREQEVRTALVDDESGKVLIEKGFGHTLGEFDSGFRIGLAQSMGTPDTEFPTDVAIDWILLTIVPSP